MENENQPVDTFLNSSHNFVVCNTDTDSVSFSAGKDLSEIERKALVKEINDISPEFMIWGDDGYYRKVIILAAKNYVLWDGEKIKYKGSAIKDQKSEIAIREFKNKIIDAILYDKTNYQEIYELYVKEILNLTDISRWSSKKTLSQTTFESKRANETKIIDAIQGTELKEGDRCWVYFDKERNLKLIENYNNDHDIPSLLKKLFEASKLFTGKKTAQVGVLPKGTFKNHSLVKNYKELVEK